MRNAIRFLRRGRPVEIADFEPTTMLLDYLRLTEGKRG
jgi:xanthine dehydrogenase small subunit